MIVQRVRLHHVDYVESVCLTRPRIAYAEVVPLSVPPSVIVRFQYQVVFEFIYLNRTSEVARFKPRLKNECVIVLGCRTVER